MLPGFPKNVTKEKVSRGRYRLTRDDGYAVEVKRGVGGWWFGNTGRKVKSLGIAEYDMRNGYTSHDQVGSANREARNQGSAESLQNNSPLGAALASFLAEG
jgi:hypothetical protein